MSEENLGTEVMVELALNTVEAMFPTLSESLKDQSAEVFRAFAEQRITFEDASNQITAILGKNDPLVKIKNIMELPPTPLPYVETELQDDPGEKGFTGQNVRKKTRTWSVMEDNRLLAGVYHFGTENWKSVAQFLGSGRNRAQCSQRWTRCLNPRISKKNWSEEENRQLEELVRINGDKSWTKISALMGNRSDVQCRYHYRQLKNESGNIELGSQLTKSTVAFNLKPSIPPPAPITPLNQSDNMSEGEDDGPIPLSATRTKGTFIASSTPNIFRMQSIFEIAKKPLFPRQFGIVGGSPHEIEGFLKNFT